MPCACNWNQLSYWWFRYSTFACLHFSFKCRFDVCASLNPHLELPLLLLDWIPASRFFSFVFIKPMNWTKSSILCPCVALLFDFPSCFCFRWIPTIRSQTRPLNNPPARPLVSQSCLITLVFGAPRLMATLILKSLLLSAIPLPLFLIGKTNHQLICVLSSFLPASVAAMWVSFVPWLEPNRLIWIYFSTLFEPSMLLFKMYLKQKLKVSINSQDKSSPPPFGSYEI